MIGAKDTPGRSRVFLLNNYALADAADRVDRAEYPSQHLWGAWELRDAFEWVIPPRHLLSPSTPLQRLLRRLFPLLGDVRQEWFVLREARPTDVIYAADQQSAALLGVLRRVRLLRTPLVVMVHNGPRAWWTAFWMRGADQLLCLGTFIKERTEARVKRPLVVMPWGPGLSSPLYSEHPGGGSDTRWGLVAAGKTNRDYETLRQSIELAELDALIFGTDGVEKYSGGKRVPVAQASDYRTVITEMRRSRSVVIPLKDSTRLSGLTEAADAFALGVPIVVSDSAAFPYDGDGIFRVPAGDPTALINGINEAAGWRASGSDVPSDKYNMAQFAEKFRTVASSLIAGIRERNGLSD